MIYRIQRILANVALLAVLAMSGSSCSSGKKLADDELVLQRNVIQMDSEDKRINLKELKSDVQTLIKQKPQKKNVLNPRTYGKPKKVSRLSGNSYRTEKDFIMPRLNMK